MDAQKKQVMAFWRDVDKNQKTTLSWMQRELPVLVADLGSVAERYRKISRVTLPMDEVNILHTRIETARQEMPEKSRKTNFTALFFAALLASKRIKTADAQFCEYMITYKAFQRRVWQKFYKGMKKAVQQADPTGPEITGVWDYYTTDLPLYRAPPCDLLDRNAEQYMRQYHTAVRPQIDPGNQTHRKIVERALANMLKVSPVSGNYYGILDQVFTYELGVRRVEELKRDGVEKVRFIAILDNATTEECRELNGKVFLVDELAVGKNAPPIYPPPHPCRSRLMALNT